MGSLADAVVDAHTEYARLRPRGAAAYQRARRVLPGGNTRSVLHFDPFPFRVVSASGPTLVDVDGHRYVDFCGNYTAGLLGHSPAGVADAVTGALRHGWSLGATHEIEIELAELVTERFASVEQVRFTNSGTEANLMAIATALHHTGRSGVGVFERGYHGGVLSFGDLDGPANPMNVPHRFVLSPFDDRAALDALFADRGLGCVLVEAVQGAGGCRPAAPEFLAELQRRCRDAGVVLILDEVMTSRLAPGGAQQLYGLEPDLTTLGKYLAGGMTFGAFGGRRDLMAQFDPASTRPLAQAGTFNNNVVSMSAAVHTLRHELDPARIRTLNERGDRLRLGLEKAFAERGAPLWVTGTGSMVHVHADHPAQLELYFHTMLADGLYLARRGFIALSAEITDHHIERLIDASRSIGSRLGSLEV